jgi:hypothetical protein
MKTGLQAVALSLIGLVTFGLLLFWPAGTFNYWQAWVFIAVFTALTAIYTIYVGVQHPEVLRRRRRAGPPAETRPVQKIVAAGVYVMFAALLVVSALDHRFGWSPAPAAISVAGDVLVAIGLGITMLVVIQNTYAAATITVEAGQKVVSTGSVWAGTFARPPVTVTEPPEEIVIDCDAAIVTATERYCAPTSSGGQAESAILWS